MKLLFSAALVAASLVVCGGCESRHMRDPEPIVSTPLEFDPTEQFELSRWWSNGKQLLRLESNASYALYPDQNRYRLPLERGRWSQQSYAVLWLEPYTQREPVRQRVSITKIDKKFALVVPKYKPMFAIKSPPEMTEDRLFGTWESAGGRLHLGTDMRYSFTPASREGAASPIARAGQNGTWSIAADRIILQPSVPRSEPVRLNMTIEEKRVAISGPDGEFTRAAEPTF